MKKKKKPLFWNNSDPDQDSVPATTTFTCSICHYVVMKPLWPAAIPAGWSVYRETGRLTGKEPIYRCSQHEATPEAREYMKGRGWRMRERKLLELEHELYRPTCEWTVSCPYSGVEEEHRIVVRDGRLWTPDCGRFAFVLVNIEEKLDRSLVESGLLGCAKDIFRWRYLGSMRTNRRLLRHRNVQKPLLSKVETWKMLRAVGKRPDIEFMRSGLRGAVRQEKFERDPLEGLR